MAEDETEQAPLDDAPAAEETVSDDAQTTAAAPAEEAPQTPAVSPRAAEPAEVLAPKERRRRARAAKAPATRAPTSSEDRQAERDQARAKKAHARRTDRVKARVSAKSGAAALAPAAVERSVGRPKARQGVVTSDKADKTITVRVDTSRRHRRYKKIVRSSKTLHAHDEANEAHEGDLVRVLETRPLSATKRWRLIEVLERAK
jgi:small subunit ribosomal protein S17